MKNSELLEQVWKAVKEGRIKVHTNLHGYIQLINTETGEKVVIGNIGGEEERTNVKHLSAILFLFANLPDWEQRSLSITIATHVRKRTVNTALNGVIRCGGTVRCGKAVRIHETD